MMDWKFGILRCKLLYREWINNKVLLYNTGNLYSTSSDKLYGREQEKEWIHIITESLWCTTEINTTL